MQDPVWCLLHFYCHSSALKVQQFDRCNSKRNASFIYNNKVPITTQKQSIANVNLYAYGQRNTQNRTEFTCVMNLNLPSELYIFNKSITTVYQLCLIMYEKYI